VGKRGLRVDQLESRTGRKCAVRNGFKGLRIFAFNRRYECIVSLRLDFAKRITREAFAEISDARRIKVLVSTSGMTGCETAFPLFKCTLLPHLESAIRPSSAALRPLFLCRSGNRRR